MHVHISTMARKMRRILIGRCLQKPLISFAFDLAFPYPLSTRPDDRCLQFGACPTRRTLLPRLRLGTCLTQWT